MPGGGGGFQTTLDGGKAPPKPKQVKYGSLLRSVKVLHNIDATRAKYGSKSGSTSSLASPSREHSRDKGKARAHSIEAATTSASSASTAQSKNRGAFLHQFKTLGQPLKATVTPNADGREELKGYGLPAFAPSPKRPPRTIELPKAPEGANAKTLQRDFKRKSSGSALGNPDRSNKLPRLEGVSAAISSSRSASGAPSNTSSSSSSDALRPPPPVPLFSTNAALELRSLTSKKGLANGSNPVTHSDMYTRTQHYVSGSTGHQQSNRAGGQVDGEASWMKLRAGKLQGQAEEKISDLFKNVVVYINGYTGASITNKELIRLIQIHGGVVHYNPSSRVTHTISTMSLSGKKTQESLSRKDPSRGSKLVSPMWVLDSIEQGKRLPERLYGVFESQTQGNLLNFWNQ